MNHVTTLSLACLLLGSWSATCLRAGEIHDAVDAGDLNTVRALLKTDPT